MKLARPSRPTLVAWGIILALLAAFIVAGLFTSSRGAYLPLDPADPSSSGSKAVVQVLQRQGVTVKVVRHPDQLAAAGPASTVVVTNPDRISLATLEQLDDAVQERLVLVAPSNHILQSWLVPAQTTGFAMQLNDSTCSGPDAPSGYRLEGPVQLYAPQDTELDPRATAESTGCFSPRTDDLTSDGHAYLSVPIDDRRRAVLVGTPTVWSNDGIEDADHAALALRVVGHGPTVLWYVPPAIDPTATEAERKGPQLIPPGTEGFMLTSYLLVLVLGLWLGRRFGPLVPEPLPVVVPASETVEGTGRLYTTTRDPAGAALHLRRATQRRLAQSAHLPPRASLDQLCQHYPHLAERLRTALTDPVTSPADLPPLLTTLRQLENEVTRR